jgi:glycosyltransferase involved in cell wall biosynthesis
MKPRFCIAQIVPKLDAGGAERSAIEIAQAVQEAGHRALIIAGHGRWSELAKRSGAELITLDLSGRSPLLLRHILTLRRILIAEKVDLIHSRSRLPSWLVWAARGLMKNPPRWVTTVHGLHSVSRYSAIQHGGEAVIAVSGCTRDYVLKNYPNAPKNIQVIPRGIELARYQTLANTASWRAEFAAEFPQLAGKRLLLLPGRGTRLKGHAHGIALLAALKTDATLALFCPGAKEPHRAAYIGELERLASSFGVQDRVVFAPARSDLIALFHEAALVLQLSDRPESFGRTVAEALACGAAVLGFDHGGVGEQLRQFFPAGAVALNDIDGLALTAKKLLAEPKASSPVGLFELAQMQRQTLELYFRLLGRG